MDRGEHKMTKIICEACDVPNPLQSKFCINCGITIIPPPPILEVIRKTPILWSPKRIAIYLILLSYVSFFLLRIGRFGLYLVLVGVPMALIYLGQKIDKAQKAKVIQDG